LLRGRITARCVNIVWLNAFRSNGAGKNKSLGFWHRHSQNRGRHRTGTKVSIIVDGFRLGSASIWAAGQKRAQLSLDNRQNVGLGNRGVSRVRTAYTRVRTWTVYTHTASHFTHTHTLACTHHRRHRKAHQSTSTLWQQTRGVPLPGRG